MTPPSPSPSPSPSLSPTDAEIAAVLGRVQTIALVGASDRPDRPSFRVIRMLLEHGYTVLPVNPALAGQTILGQPVLASLDHCPASVDMVDVFRRSDALEGLVADAIRLDIPIVWSQLGVIDEVAAAQARAAGLTMIMDRCPAIEIPRLGVARRPAA